MLKFSYSYDLKVIDERYRELFETKQYYKSMAEKVYSLLAFYEYVKLLLKSQCMLFKKNMVYVGGLNERETGFMNFLIFNPEIKHFLIHVELNI